MLMSAQTPYHISVFEGAAAALVVRMVCALATGAIGAKFKAGTDPLFTTLVGPEPKLPVLSIRYPHVFADNADGLAYDALTALIVPPLAFPGIVTPDVVDDSVIVYPTLAPVVTETSSLFTVQTVDPTAGVTLRVTVPEDEIVMPQVP